MRWKFNPCSERHWGAEKFLLFNAGSAQTHQLNLFAADIICVLKDCPLDSSELRKRLIDLYKEVEFDANVANYLQETLDLLDGLGLIQPELM